MTTGRIHNFAFFLLTFYFLKPISFRSPRGLCLRCERSKINHFESIMQNKPNWPNALMNVTSFYTVDYENKRLTDMAKTKPIQTQYKAKTNPIPEKPKMNVTSILTKDYENKPPSSPKKTNPIQTQSNPISKACFLTGLTEITACQKSS